MIEADDPIWIEVIEIASIAARKVAYKYHGYVQADDLRQVASEYAFRRKGKVAEYLIRDDPHERRQGEKALLVSMVRECDRYARREKASKSGYRPEDEYFYRPEMIEKIIEVIYNDTGSLAGQILDPAELGGKRRTKPASEGGDVLAMVADVESALKELQPREYSILLERFAYGTTLQVIGDDWGISPQRVEQLSQRAMRQVIEALGGPSPY
jgi:RNA polymerase sigma factor (sigma-70 family)